MNQRLRGKGKLTRQDVAKLRSTFATEKRGCNSYRGKPRSESGEELQCCIDGFYKGLEKLAQQVDQSFKKDSELAKSEDFGRCRTSYSAGDADGKIRCEYELPSEGGARNNCPKYSFDSVAYIGCYQIGFLRALEACGCPTARDEVASVKTRAPAIFAEKALGKPASLKIGNTTLYPVAEPANAQQAK